MLVAGSILAFLRSPLGKASLLAVALGGFYLWAYDRGHDAAQASFDAAVRREVLRQTAGIETALKAAQARALLAEVQEARAEAAVQQAIEAARKSSTARQVCLTEEVTDALRSIK